MRLFIPSIAFIIGISISHTTLAKIPGQGLTISPPLLELQLKPGETVTQTIKVTNPTENLVEVYPTVMNFGAKGEGGEPTFFPASEEVSKFSLANWVKVTQTKIALTPEQVVDFQYQIEVPLDVEPGGHYGVVFFASQPTATQTGGNEVALSSMTGSLVLVTIPGENSEQGAIDEFWTRKFFMKPPIDFSVKIKNTGNTHFKPVGDVVVRDTFNKELAKLPINEIRGNVLPASSRRFDVKYETEKFVFGRFTADLSAVYGKDQQTLHKQIVFWIVPWQVMAAIGLLLLIIIYIIFRIRRWRKRKNQPNQYPGQPPYPQSPGYPPVPPQYYQASEMQQSPMPMSHYSSQPIAQSMQQPAQQPIQQPLRKPVQQQSNPYQYAPEYRIPTQPVFHQPGMQQPSVQPRPAPVKQPLPEGKPTRVKSTAPARRTMKF